MEMPRGASRELVLNQREWPKKSTADSTAVGKGVTLCPGACAPIPPNALHSLGTAASAWGALGCLQQVCVWVAGSLPSSCKRLALTASPGLPGDMGVALRPHSDARTANADRADSPPTPHSLPSLPRSHPPLSHGSFRKGTLSWGSGPGPAFGNVAGFLESPPPLAQWPPSGRLPSRRTRPRLSHGPWTTVVVLVTVPDAPSTP